MNRICLLFASIGALLAPASAAQAATCTVSGVLDIQPWITYYCDTAVAGNDCSGWTETNLHSATRPMRHMQVRIIRQWDGAIVGWGTTNQSGAYSISWEQDSCVNTQFRMSWLYKRLEPALFDSPTRFRIVGASESTTHAGQTPIFTFGSGTCGASSCTVGQRFARTTLYTNRMANVYYQADSTITQMATWSSNLNTQFAAHGEATDGTGPLRIVYHSGVPAVAQFERQPWMLRYGYDLYRRGTLRHELGHAAHHAMHKRKQNVGCFSYRFNGDNSNMGIGNHGMRSCEYGSTASIEGIATFLGVRSIVTGSATGNNAWHCFCDLGGIAGQNVCSLTAVAALPGDRIGNCVNGLAGFVGIGDTFADSPARCSRLAFNGGCGLAHGVDGTLCTDTDGNNRCDGDWHEKNGHRNEDQIARFLWDVIDNNNDSGGSDTSNLSMAQLTAAFEGMPCTDKCDAAPTPPNDCGAPGTCNEFNGSWLDSCVPDDGTMLPPPPAPQLMNSTRDAYNAHDLAWMIPGDQTSLRTLNCVQTAN